MADRTCSVEGCDMPTGQSGTALGLCSSHYHKLRRHGSVRGKVRPQRERPPDHLAYAAGFVDADGSIMISVYRATQLRPERFTPRVAGANLTTPALDLLRDLFGGSLYLSRARNTPTPGRPNLNCRDMWHWSVVESAAIEAAEAMLPYLRVKRRQAELLIEFRDGATWTKGGLDRAVPDEELARRRRLRNQVRRLNGKKPEDDGQAQEEPA